MNTVDTNRDTIRLLILTITLFLIVWYLLQSFDYAYKRYYNADELRYGHAAWLVAKGYLPYIDFWDAKFPFMYQFMSMIFKFAGDHPGNVLFLRLVMFIMLCVTCTSVYIINKRSELSLAAITPVMLLSVWSYVFMAIEIQPDGMATALFFASIAILYTKSISPSLRGFFSGILFTLCLWTSQKVFCYGIIFPIAFIIDISINFKRKKYILGNPFSFLFGSFLILSVIFYYLLSTDSLYAWYEYCIREMFFSSKSILPFRPKHITFARLFHDAWALFPFIGFGFYKTVKGLSTRNCLHDQEILLLLSLPSCFLVWYLQKGPYLYSMLPLMACISIFAGRGIIAAFQTVIRLIEDERRIFYITLLTVLVLIHMVPSISRSRFADIPDNKYQHDIFNTINVLTETSDPVYDNSGSYVSRPHAYFYYFTSVLMRQKWMRDQLIKEVPESIRKKECTVFIYDIRTKSLPKQLVAWLETHFLPYNKDIYIWGSEFNSGDSGKVAGNYEAVRTAKYFISPQDLFEKGQLIINGNEIKSQIFALEKGNNEIVFSGNKNIKFRILWLPRNNLPFEASFPLKNANDPFSYILYPEMRVRWPAISELLAPFFRKAD